MPVREGDRFGRLTAIEKLSERATDGHQLWRCSCECGSHVVRQCNNLQQSKALQSCGCYSSDVSKTHGMKGTKTYSSWRSAKARCNNPNDKDFGNYGGRGIAMCPEWSESFESFYADMGERPAGTTLERCDVNGPYAKWNCKWATRKEQNLNKRITVNVEKAGVRMHISDAAQQLGITNGAAHQRLKRGKLHDYRRV